jgi:hypothetical protein
MRKPEQSGAFFTPMSQNVITMAQASEILEISQPAITRRIQRGSVKPIGKFGGMYMLDREQILKLKSEIERERYK